MANYKVIQDIEAEDKLVGPLSLRQFIYAGIAALCFYVSFICFSKSVGWLSIPFIPVGLFCTFFAFPWSREQPTEVWALAKIRFFLKPRRRIWNQSGVKELVTITVPKKVEKIFTNGLSQNEVQSRLNALASTIDSRGWAIKNVNANLYSQPMFVGSTTATDSDRLIDISSMPQQVPTTEVLASDDIMDAQNNQVAHQFDEMIQSSAQSHRQQIEQQLQQPTPTMTAPTAAQTTPPADYWFLNQSPGGGPAPTVIVPGSDDQQAGVHAADPTPSEEALAAQLRAQHYEPRPSYSHMKNIRPLGAGGSDAPAAPAVTTPAGGSAMTPATDPAKIDLARNNDLSVATIARLANEKGNDEPEEVVISLH